MELIATGKYRIIIENSVVVFFVITLLIKTVCLYDPEASVWLILEQSVNPEHFSGNRSGQELNPFR